MTTQTRRITSGSLEGYGAGLFGGTTAKKSTSQPGTFPIGVGGGIAQMIASRREGAYAFMSPEAQLDLRMRLELNLVELDEQEHEWRLGLVKDKDSKWDKLLSLYKARAAIAQAGGAQRTQKLMTLTNVFGEMGVDPFSAGVLNNNPLAIDGVIGLTGEVGTAMQGLVPKGGILASEKSSFQMQTTKEARAQWITDRIGKQIEPFADQARNYGKRAGVAAGYGQLATTAMVQNQVGLLVSDDISKFLVHAMPDSTVAERKEVLSIFMNRHITKGNTDWGRTDTDAVMKDRTDLDKQVTQKILSSDYIHEYLKKGGGFDERSGDADELQRILNLPPDDLSNPMSEAVPPNYMTNRRAALEAQLVRLDHSDPYADQVIRVAELQGFDQYKAALGIKGSNYESNRKAAMIMAKDPAAATAAFRFYTQAKISGVPEAKLDVMYRQYLSQGGAPEGGAFGSKLDGDGFGRAVVNVVKGAFGMEFDSESVRRAKLAGMSPSEIESIGATVANFITTNEFKYIKPPFATRYQEFKDSLIEKYAGETNADARTLLMEVDTAAWLNRQDAAELDSDEGAGVISTIENETTKAVQWHNNMRSLAEGGGGVRFKDEQELLSEDLKHWEEVSGVDTSEEAEAARKAARAIAADLGGERPEGVMPTSGEAQEASETYGVEPPKPVTADSTAPVNGAAKKGGKKGGTAEVSALEQKILGTGTKEVSVLEQKILGTYKL